MKTRGYLQTLKAHDVSGTCKECGGRVTYHRGALRCSGLSSWSVRKSDAHPVSVDQVKWSRAIYAGKAIALLLKWEQRKYREHGESASGLDVLDPEAMLEHPLAAQYRTLLREVWS